MITAVATVPHASATPDPEVEVALGEDAAARRRRRRSPPGARSRGQRITHDEG